MRRPHLSACAGHAGPRLPAPRGAPRGALYLALLLLLPLLPPLLLSACGVVRLGDLEPPPGRRVIVEIALEGNRHVPTNAVVAELSNQAQGLSVPAADALVDTAEIALDARRVESIYKAHGYFRARVRGYRVEELPNRTARVVFSVEEGPPTTVTRVNFAGLDDTGGADPEADRRLAELAAELPNKVPLRAGQVWTEEGYERGLTAITRALRERGFVHVKVAGDTFVSRERNQAGVYYKIQRGPLTRISEVRVVGEHHVPEARIRRRIGLRPGQIIEPSALRDTEAAVYDLGVFFSATARPLRGALLGAIVADAAPAAAAEAGDSSATPNPAAAIPVEISVQEMAIWDASVGFSATTDSVKAQLALPLTYQHRNLFDELIGVRLSAEPAIVIPDIGQDWSQVDLGLETRGSLRWPSFIEEYLELQLQVRYQRDPSQEASNDEWGGSLGVARKLTSALTARLGWNFSFFRFFDSKVSADAVRDEAIEVAELRFQDQDFLSYLDLGLVLDLRDGLYDPRSGFYASARADLAWPSLGSDVEYARVSLDARGYLPVARWLTVALRTRVGWNFFPVGQGTPEPARFSSGGPSTHRGFSAGRMGDYVCGVATEVAGEPRYLNVPCSRDATDRTYVGGNYLIETNAELRFYLLDWLGLVAFIDVGRLWSQLADIDLADPYIAAGPGLRLFTPVGPVRFDVGILAQGPGAVSAEWFLSLGQAF